MTSRNDTKTTKYDNVVIKINFHIWSKNEINQTYKKDNIYWVY